MGYMEIALLPNSVLRIKGKNATFVVNPQGAVVANAALLLDPNAEYESEEVVTLSGAGEYEIGGAKLTGLRNEKSVLYSIHIDGMDVAVGTIILLSEMQHKLKEHNLIIVNCENIIDASFLTSLAVNAVIFYGEKATEVAQGFEKEKLKTMNKYTASLGKLPAEMETILLS
ncbi:MAG TPA: hypothetical protein VNW29_07545 [Candidatus Sulfotelmatobacter sp.]|jgi:hypothetical protein|nr:hypothetical protein [Candidatus Sulfotelmatobacter sp.]